MNLEVDFLIDFFRKHTPSKSKGEIGEQEAAAAPSSGGGGGGKAPPKWSDVYPIKRGKANMLGKAGEKWETGATRGAANQIW
jgi:hypothetical protein